MSRVWSITIDEFLEIAKALSNETRLEIFKKIQQSTMNVNEIAEMFNLPSSTATVNVKKLEEAGLIRTELVPGTRGSQKVCSTRYDRLVVELTPRRAEMDPFFRYVHMPIGHFTDCEVKPTCGLVMEDGIVGYFDEPRSFFEPEKVHAQLLWFRQGYVEYRFPNRVPYDCRLTGLEISMEICSEAPLYNNNWPSDITLWINGVEIGTWMSPGDFGGERGLLTPVWWETRNTQFGLLKSWRVTEQGSYIDGSKISSVSIGDLGITGEVSSFPVRIGVKADAVNLGGLNLFGRKFGNYEQDILLRFDFEPAEPAGMESESR
jgi:predicted transcriptional regulator